MLGVALVNVLAEEPAVHIRVGGTRRQHHRSVMHLKTVVEIVFPQTDYFFLVLSLSTLLFQFLLLSPPLAPKDAVQLRRNFDPNARHFFSNVSPPSSSAVRGGLTARDKKMKGGSGN